jgi:hypothetical protein
VIEPRLTPASRASLLMAAKRTCRETGCKVVLIAAEHRRPRRFSGPDLSEPQVRSVILADPQRYLV